MIRSIKTVGIAALILTIFIFFGCSFFNLRSVQIEDAILYITDAENHYCVGDVFGPWPPGSKNAGNYVISRIEQGVYTASDGTEFYVDMVYGEVRNEL